MSIRKREWGDGNEAWQVDLLIKGKRLRKQFPTKKEAKAYEGEIDRQVSAGTYRAVLHRRTLHSMFDEYVKHLAQRNADGERMSRLHMNITLGHIRNYVLGGNTFRRRGKEFRFDHGIDEIQLDEITPKDINDFLKQVVKSGLSAKAAKEVRNATLVMLEYARLNLYIGVNPARGIGIFADTAPEKIAPPSKTLVKGLIEHSDGRNRVLIMLAAFTGVRAGELRAIRWRHVDFTKSMLSITTSMDRWGDDSHGPKTKAGVRAIPLSPLLTDVLKTWRAQRKPDSLDCLLFTSSFGKPIGHHNLRNFALDPAFKAAINDWCSDEIPPAKPRWHDLRHFAASCWIEAGLPAKAIQTFMGHTDIATTMNIYGHLFPSPQHHETMSLVASEILGMLRPSTASSKS